jgi:hypothetical protein
LFRLQLTTFILYNTKNHYIFENKTKLKNKMLKEVLNIQFFGKTSANETETSQKTQEINPSNIEEISSQLNLWMHQGAPDEKRLEAKNKMMAAYENQAQEVRLNSMELRDLPAVIGQFQHLKSLCLWGNKLQSLPPSVGQLNQLIKLNLGRNEFKSFPLEIAQLSQLQELNVRGNPLTRLPSEIEQLPNLSTIHSEFPWIRPKQRESLQFVDPLYTTHTLDIPQLPEDLANSGQCLQFFNAFSHYLNSHYFAIQTLTSSSLLEPKPTWTQTLSNALQIFSIVGSLMTGEALNNLAQKRAHTEASEQALLIVKLFPTPLHYIATVQYAGVLFTQRLADTVHNSNQSAPSSSQPQTQHYTKTLGRAYSTLQTKAGLQIEHPWEKNPSAKNMATRFLMNLIENPKVHAFAQPNNLGLQHYAQNMAKIVVDDILGPKPQASHPPLHVKNKKLEKQNSFSSSSSTLSSNSMPNPQDELLLALAPIQQQINALSREVNQLKEDNEALKQELRNRDPHFERLN